MLTFGEKLKELRDAKGMTQAELSEKTGISQTAISHWELDSRKPSFENVRTICEALECSIDKFKDVVFVGSSESELKKKTKKKKP